MSQQTASKFLEHFLSLLSLVYVNKRKVFKSNGNVLDIKPRPGPLLGALQKHVLFPCPSVRPSELTAPTQPDWC